MNGRNISFNNRNIKKATFTIKKMNIDGIDINKILASKKNNMLNIIQLTTLLRIIITDRVIRPLYLFVSQMAGYINKFVSHD